MTWIFLFFAGLQLFTTVESRADSASGIVIMDFDLSKHDITKEVDLWIPYPVSSMVQDISEIQVTGDFAESAIYTDKKYQTTILYAKWKKTSNSRRLQLTFKAVRQEVVKRDLPAEDTVWNKKDFDKWLAPTSLGPVDGPVGELSTKITKGKNTTLEKAKAIYDWVCENMYRDSKTIGCGKGDVCLLLQTPGGKCTDIHSVFVALCRAAGVPAREIFGIRLGKNDVQDISTGQHCWAEFYAEGKWWPVDISEANKYTALATYYFGRHPANRIEFTRGRDLQIEPGPKSGSINFLAYPVMEIGNTPALAETFFSFRRKRQLENSEEQLSLP